MKTALEIIAELNELNETEGIEAKRGREAGRSIMETICAFSNEPGLNGGYIILGVSAGDTSSQTGLTNYVVEGVSEPERISADIATNCSSQFNIPIRLVFSTEKVEGKTVLLIKVDELKESQKPLYFRKDGLPKGAYRRISSTDQRCIDDDLVMFYRDRQDTTYDATIIEGAEVEKYIDKSAVEEYRKIIQRVRPESPELNWGDLQIIEGIDCAAIRNNVLTFNVAGLVLFGSSLALKKFKPMQRIDYIVTSGKQWVEDSERRFDFTLEFREPLMLSIDRIVAIVFNDVPKMFSLPKGHVQRTETPYIAQKALREAIVNAVMHRDYTENSSMMIVRYSNRLEIMNAGYSLKEPDEFELVGSKTRNTIIANVLHDTYFAETKGSGIRTIRDEMQRLGLIPPTFESSRKNNKFLVTFFLHHFLSKEDWKWLDEFKSFNLSNDEARALILCREKSRIDNSDYRDINRVDVMEASKSLTRLRDLDIFVQNGKGSATYYSISEKYSWTNTTDENTQAGSENTQAESGNTQAESENTQAKRNKLMEEINDELKNKIKNTGAKAELDDVTNVIYEICDLKPFTAVEIAIILNRETRWLVRKYLKPMVEKGLLERTQKSNTHPEQKYISIPQKKSKR